MSEVPTHALVLDLETTGISLDSEVLEVGAVLVTVPDLATAGMFSALVKPWQPVEQLRRTVHPVVEQMHADNGLWDDLSHASDLTTPLVMDHKIVQWLNDLGAPAQNIYLAGSNSARFDATYIRRDFPVLHKRLHYSGGYDVGVIRRFMTELSGLPPVDTTGQSADASVKAHRALADALAHLTELRAWRDAVRRPVED